MKKGFHRFFGALFLPISCLLALQARAETLTYPELVQRVTDLEGLALPPQKDERVALESTYDRKRQYDAKNDKYLNWGADGDQSNVVRMEGDKAVMADLKGPGVIWRMWSARPKDGHVKIYIDGSPTPAVDLPFTHYFGADAPFNRPHLAYMIDSSGSDSYVPIPYEKSCKIVADPGWGCYDGGGFYQFTYTTFPAGTIVPSFSLPLSAADAAALDSAEKILGQKGQDPAGNRPGAETTTARVTVPAHGKATVADLSGAGAITGLKVKLAIPGDHDQQRALFRQLAISITWDHDRSPAVWSPLGDYFADAMTPAPYDSLPMGRSADGTFYSFWYMPYGNGARIKIINDSPRPVPMTWEIVHALLTQPAASLPRFHAKWHRDAFIPARKDRWPDWTLLKTTGRGCYVGTQLHVWNARPGWWGEGNDKFFVDGEKFPSILGTGSEDYFGFAFGTGLRANPLQGQAASDGFDESDYRWHIPDAVPFQKSFEGCIEKYQSNDRPVLYDAVAYWYLAPGGKDPYEPLPVSQRTGYMIPPVVHREPDVIEGEYLDRIDWNVDWEQQEMWTISTAWSNNMQLLWHAKKIGDHGTFGFKVPNAGTYRLLARFSHAPGYGVVQVGINGAKIGAPIDLYAATLAPADPVDVGTVRLNAGSNTLGLDCVGKNSAATGYDVGLDYLKPVLVR